MYWVAHRFDGFQGWSDVVIWSTAPSDLSHQRPKLQRGLKDSLSSLSTLESEKVWAGSVSPCIRFAFCPSYLLSPN
jgi:hypothetical protein